MLWEDFANGAALIGINIREFLGLFTI